MIGSLRGTLLDRQPARTGPGAEVTIEVAGVGYRVVVAAGALGVLGELGGPAFVHVHTHVREDAITLYGFPTRDERQVFEALLGAPGIGPAVALAILATHSPTALRRVARTEDVDALCMVPGIGRKTAAKLLLELQGRLDLDVLDRDGDVPGLRVVGGEPGPARDAHAEVRAALAGLGYGPDEVRETLRALPEAGEVDALLRRALRTLAVAR
ncbi:MAG: Holliday junction branch migration protein RuvA [Acidimicrobiales bacterium]